MKPSEIVARLVVFLPSELRRARRQVRGAGRKSPGAPVHEARKSIKKLRAALRLAENMAPERPLAAVERALRDAAHALGPLRDHLVLNRTGRDLAKRGEKAPPESESPGAKPLLKRASTRLRQAAGGLSRLIDGGLEESGVESGLRRIYKRASEEMAKARKSPSDENLHAWRRRAKDLLYVLELVGAPERFVRKLDKLGQHLGNDHDLATFVAHHNSSAGKGTHGRLLSRAKKQRGPLQKKAFRIGEKLLKASPRKFVRRMVG